MALVFTLLGEGSVVRSSSITFFACPRAQVLDMLDKVCILSTGRPMYFGPTKSMTEYFASVGHPCPAFSNPSDFVLSYNGSHFCEPRSRNVRVTRGHHQGKNSLATKRRLPFPLAARYCTRR